jgi:hypothetical protein
LVAAFLAAAVPARSQTGRPRDPNSAIALIRGFVESVYPEIIGQDRYMRISIGQSVDRSWLEVYGVGFEIETIPPGVSFSPSFDRETGKQTSPPQNETLLSGQLQFDGDGNVENLWVDSALTNGKQNDALHHLVQAHPEWPEAKSYDELKKAGALYGPAEKEQFVKALHIDRFEKLLGRLTVTSVEFDGLTREHVGSFSMLDWRVNADADPGNGTHASYVFTFEPFGGRFVGLLRLHHQE